MALSYYRPKLASMAALGMTGYANQKTMATYAAKGRKSYVLRRKQYKRPLTLTQAIRNNAVVNHLGIGDGSNAVNLSHNTITTQNLNWFVVQGTTQYQRQGDTIYNEVIKFNGFWDGPTVSSNGVQLRLIVMYHDDYHANDYINDSGLGLTDIAMVGTGTARSSTLITDPKKCTVLDDRTFALNQSIAGVAETTIISYTVPIKRRFDFQPGTQEGKDRNLYIVAIPSIAGGVTGTTACGTLYLNEDVIFRCTK